MFTARKMIDSVSLLAARRVHSSAVPGHPGPVRRGLFRGSLRTGRSPSRLIRRDILIPKLPPPPPRPALLSADLRRNLNSEAAASAAFPDGPEVEGTMSSIRGEEPASPADLFRPAGDLSEAQPARLASDLLQPRASLRRPHQLTGGEPGLEVIDHVSLPLTVELDPGQILQRLVSLPPASEKTLQACRRDAGFENDPIIHALFGALTDRLEPFVRCRKIFLCEVDLHELELSQENEIALLAAYQNLFRTVGERQRLAGSPLGLPKIRAGPWRSSPRG